MKTTTNLVILFFLINTISCFDKEKDCKCRTLPDLKTALSTKAHHLAYPWIVSLSINEDKIPKHLRKFVKNEKKSEFHSCSGIIVNEKWILTVAHCAPPYELVVLHAGFGNDNDLEKIYDFGRIQSVRLLSNPGFKFESRKEMILNDIALIELKEPIKFTENIKPACFLNENFGVFPGYLNYAGWLSTDISETKDLLKLKVFKSLKEMIFVDQSDSDESCRFYEKVICSKTMKKNENKCFGDSGGSIHYTKNNKSFVVGLASFSPERYWKNPIVQICTGTTVFTRVSSHISWIKRLVGNDICEY